MTSLQGALQQFDAAFCCIAAYMKLDGIEAIRKVDYDYTVACADVAEKCCIQSFSLLTMHGDPDISEDATGWQAYKRIKGLAEQKVVEKLKSAQRPGGIQFIYIY